MEKLSISEIAEAVGGKLLGKDCFVCDVCTDNRLAKQGSLFIAIAGENHDGHKFAASAVENGAVAVMLEKDIKEISCGKIIVSSSKDALGRLGSYYLEKMGTKVLAITGSVGKTTTRNMAHSAVCCAKKAIKTIKNYNNDIGLPLTVLTQITKDTEIAVLEMGMNHFGEISYLSRLAKPECAIITNIGMSHIENLGSREGILKAKLEICDYMKSGGRLILNGDEPLLKGFEKEGTDVKYFSVKDKSADYYGENIVSEDGGVSFDLCSEKGVFKVKLNVPGEHNVYNALASFAAADFFGVLPELAVSGLGKFVPGDMRMEFIRKEDFCIINDCYNASPDSVKAALNVLGETKYKNKIAILGDMLEMGSFAPEAHRETGKYAAIKADKVICTGELGRFIKEGAADKGIWCEDKLSVIEEIKQIKSDSCILIKASRGMHFEQITNALLEE